MDSQLDVLWNPRPNLSMTKFMPKPTLCLDRENQLGLVLVQKEGPMTLSHGFTQVVELKLSLKIGSALELKEDQITALI